MSSYRLMKKRQKPGRKISGVKTGSALTLVKRQNKIYSAAERFIETTAAESLRLLIEASFNELHMNSFNNSRLCVHDNYLLSAYARLIKGYSNIIAYYNKVEAGIHEAHSKTILRGIRTIFYTRLSEYKEMEVEALYDIKNEHEGNYLMQFSEDIAKMVEGGYAKLLNYARDTYFKDIWNIDEQRAEEMAEDIKADVIRSFSGDVYNIYKNCSYRALDESKKEQARERIDNCFLRIKQEHDILNAIVKIQAPELESRNSELSVVAKILNMLREEYQKIAFDINHIEALYRQAEIGEDEDEDFNTFLGRVSVFINSKDTLAENKDKFICEYVFLLDDFDEGVREYVNNNFNKRMERLDLKILGDKQKQAVEGTRLLASKVIDEFRNAVSQTDSDKDAYKEDESSYQIIQGIHETLSIKVQSMDEMLSEYYENIKPYLDRKLCLADLYSNATISADIEKQLNKYKAEHDESFEDLKASSNMLEHFLKETSLNIKNKALLLVKKNIESDRADVSRMDSRFKKECVFFEIITFEEIINYRISKLLESENTAVTDYAAIVTASDESIKEYMKAVGIDIISPKAHDIFNGKIHEVLMAKEEEGFEKGEIIKVVNNGYKEGGVIYARANVICAK